MEIGELAGLRKADVEAIKSYISTQQDRCRMAYGRRIESFPRQCIFFGTTNNRDFLHDPTGNRRFWPLDTHDTPPRKSVFNDLTDHEITQIWAEAVQLYHAGEPLYLDAELEKCAQQQQTDHAEYNEKEGIIRQYLDMPLPTNWARMDTLARRAYIDAYRNRTDNTENRTVARHRVCVAEICCELFGYLPREIDRRTSFEILKILRNIEGWEESKFADTFSCYGTQRFFKRI